MQKVRLTIHGLVQNVFFRDTAKKIAEQFGIVGFVKNQDDGTVYIEAQGDEQKLKNFISWCRVGPKSARVDKIEIENTELSKYDSFTIK